MTIRKLDFAQSHTTTDLFNTVNQLIDKSVGTVVESDATWDLTIDLLAAPLVKHTMTKPTLTITFDNVPVTAGQTTEVTLLLEQGAGSGKVNWPEGIRWQNGREPILSYQQGSVNVIQFMFLDGDPNPYGFFIAGWM